MLPMAGQFSRSRCQWGPDTLAAPESNRKQGKNLHGVKASLRERILRDLRVRRDRHGMKTPASGRELIGRELIL